MSGQHSGNSLLTVEELYAREYPGVGFRFSQDGPRHRKPERERVVLRGDVWRPEPRRWHFLVAAFVFSLSMLSACHIPPATDWPDPPTEAAVTVPVPTPGGAR